MLIKVDKFIYLFIYFYKFLIKNIVGNFEVSIVIGRPFMTISVALIDMHVGNSN